MLTENNAFAKAVDPRKTIIVLLKNWSDLIKADNKKILQGFITLQDFFNGCDLIFISCISVSHHYSLGNYCDASS